MKKVIVFILILALQRVCLLATTIIPYPDLGELCMDSDYILYGEAMQYDTLVSGERERYRYQFQVLNTIKGERAFSRIELFQFFEKNGKEISFFFGELDLTVGSRYVLFLNRIDGRFVPVAMSYYTLKERQVNGRFLLTPSEKTWEFHLSRRPDGKRVEAPGIYDRDRFIQHLRMVAKGEAKWDREEVAVSPSEIPGHVFSRDDPPGCGYLGGDQIRFKWQNFEAEPLMVHYVGDDPGRDNEADLIGLAVEEINKNYPGVWLQLEGKIEGYIPDCGAGSVYGDQLIDWVSENLGGSRHLVIQFDDPCNELTGNTWGRGGLGATTEEIEFIDGIMYYSAKNGFVLLDEGIDEISETDYVQLLIHEMSHALGIGHHLDQGNNMYINCCAPISLADMECAQLVYYEISGILPVELIDFNASAMGETVELNWITASESNNEGFHIERSRDGRQWESIGFRNGKGTTITTARYTFHDLAPENGINYYRLKQVDFDGRFEYSQVVNVLFGESDALFLRLHGSLVTDQLTVSISAASVDGSLQVFNAVGQLIFEILKPGASLTFSVSNLFPGAYTIVYRDAAHHLVERFVKY